MLRLIKIYYSTLSILSPKLAAKSAFEIFQKVRKKDIRKREEMFFSEAKKYTLKFGKEDLACYEFGSEHKDVVVLVHGWDSNAGCMYGFIEELLKNNKRIISFNLPAHAFYKASKTNLYECKMAFKVLISNLPEYKKLSIISHSFGSAISSYALSELDVELDRLVFLTSPNVIEDVFLDFKKMIALNDKSYQYLKLKADDVLGEKLEELSVEKKLTEFSFNHLHLIHDKNDKIIPYSNTVNIHKKIANSTITSYEDIGHYRMLWNQDVISKSISYLNN